MKITVEDYIKKRNELIDKLDANEISKPKFIEENNLLIYRSNIRPFIQVKSVSEGLYNYQYYNLKAKEYNSLANKYKYKKNKKYQLAIGKSRNYYVEKDKSIAKILELIDYKNVDAYMIEVLSTRMKGKLYEIVLKDYEKMIFHTIDEDIKNDLIKRGIFDKNPRKSLIDSYVNQGY
ncbi:MAG: DUF6648 family protein [Finegoldia sp.]|nr:DUF6648 family protein [Finegoldia sp.]